MVFLHQVAAAIPWLVFGLQAGALVDRWDQARLLMFADVARALLGGGLAVLVLPGHANIWALLMFAFCSSVATVLFHSADAALLPTLVDAADMPKANGPPKSDTTAAANFVEARTRPAHCSWWGPFFRSLSRPAPLSSPLPACDSCPAVPPHASHRVKLWGVELGDFLDRTRLWGRDGLKPLERTDS